MKKQFVILMLFLGTVLQAQTFSFNCFVGSNDYETNYGFRLQSPNDMYAAFEADVTAYNTSNVNDISLPDSPYPYIQIIPASYWEKNDNVAAYTWYCSDTPNIRINGGWWNNPETTIDLKMLVMYHELGHSILNFEHTCNTGDIMVSPGAAAEDPDCDGTNPEGNLAAFLVAKDTMLSGAGQIAHSCNSGKGSNEVID